MNQPRSMLSSILWMFLLFLFGACVTCAVFCVFVMGPERGMTFYFALGLVIAAEFVLFLHLANPGARAGGTSSSPATRYMAQGAIFIWFILTLIVAAFAVHPSRADTIASDKILIIDLILTFFLLVCLYAIYAKDLQIGQINQALADERAEIQFDIPALEEVMRFANELGGKHKEHAVLADRVRKKIDTVRSAIDGVMVSESALTSDSGGEDWPRKIQEQIAKLVGFSSESDMNSEQAQEALDKTAKQADTILSTLKQRERSFTS